MPGNRIFVFGSNTAGHHGAGSAAAAMQEHGAEWGVAEGRTGNAYAIPTCDSMIRPLAYDFIATSVRTFLRYASAHPDLTFDVVKIGTGIAGFAEAEMAPLFAGAPSNVNLPDGWRVLSEVA